MTKPPLVNQPTKAPTRKLWAIGIAGCVVGVAFAMLSAFWPTHPLAEYQGPAVLWLAMMISQLTAGYQTRNRAK
jgi:hypothetical protein